MGATQTYLLLAPLAYLMGPGATLGDHQCPIYYTLGNPAWSPGLTRSVRTSL
eukprot:SAG31_NODE_8978_length_1354_cov_0.987251_1_plen_51_part_10